MKLAYLILAHKDPAHVGRVVRRLQHPDASVFVHIDKKSAIEPFRESLEGLDVTVLENRIKVYWAGFSSLQAIMNMIDEALRDPRQFSHFCLLSGSDYPIKSNRQIFEFLTREPKNFVNVGTNLSASSHRNAISGFHFKDIPWLNPKVPVETIADRVLSFLCNRAIWAVQLDKRKRRLPAGFDFYRGSAWWCLTRQTAEHVRAFCREHPTIYNFNRFAHAPDEILIQSILMNSRAGRLEIDEEQLDALPASFSAPDNVYGLHYIDWRNQGSHPKILTQEDFANLRDTPALFARKFDPNTSAAVLDLIDAHLLDDAPDADRAGDTKPSPVQVSSGTDKVPYPAGIDRRRTA